MKNKIAGASMIAAGVSSAIVNDDFEKVIEDILDIEELGYQKGCETFSARLGERTKIGLELAKTYRYDEEAFLKKVYDVIGAGVGMIESVPAAISIAYYAQDPNRACLMCANLGGRYRYNRGYGNSHLWSVYGGRPHQEKLY